MEKAFKFRMEVSGYSPEILVHAPDIKTAIERWVGGLKGVVGEFCSLDSESVAEIKKQFENQEIKFVKNRDLQYLTYTLNGNLQTTLIIPVDKGPPDFIARLRFLLPEEGGRSHYAVSGYRPHFSIEGVDYLTSSDQSFVGTDKVWPGEEVVSEIRILSIEPFEGLMEAGMAFKLGEGSRTIATGEILEVINNRLAKLD